jgi:hypothetical protein
MKDQIIIDRINGIENELLEIAGKIIQFRKDVDNLPKGGADGGAYDYYVDVKQLEAIANNAFADHHVTVMKLHK